MRAQAWFVGLSILIRREVLLSAAVVFLLGYAWMPTVGVSSPNERSRIYLGVAIVDHHTLQIDRPIQRWGILNDMATYRNHFFTDKAPGTSFLVAAVYGICRLFLPANDFSIESLLSLTRRTIMLPMGLLGFWLFRRLARHLDLPLPVIDIVSLTWILGTAAAHASAGLVGHQIVSVCLLGALWALCLLEQRSAADPRYSPCWLPIAVGLVAGFSVFSEYQSAIPFGLLGLYILSGPLRRQLKQMLWMLCGVLPGVIGLLLYNRFAFCGFFELSYQHLVGDYLQQLHGQGIGGVKLPKLEYAQAVLFSWHRGLLTNSPFFLLAPLGLGVLWRRGLKRLVLLLGVTFAYYILFVSSTAIWYGGWGFGPRLIVPVMGWAALLGAFGYSSLQSSWGKGLALGMCFWGILYTQSVNMVFPELPERFTHPLPGLVVPALREGVLVPNLLIRLTGIKGVWSLIPLSLVLFGLLFFLVRRELADYVFRTRLVIGFVALVTLLAFGSTAYFTGPGVSPVSTTNQLKWMRSLMESEMAMWRR